MKINYLWDEEKTRKLFKTHLILFLVGGLVASAYVLLLPLNSPNYPLILAIPLLFTLSCFIYLTLLNRPNPGVKLLIFTLEAQLAASIFMAATGGFLGIVQFAPYMFLIFAVFELGAEATVILGLFSICSFIAILLWMLLRNPQPNLLPEFFYYVGSYILILVIERNLGREISIQFEARKRLEEVDSLKNQFIALTSHYLRTPLTVIKSSIYQLQKSQANPEEQKGWSEVKTNISKLESLIEELLNISSIEKGQAKILPQLADLNKIVSDTVTGYQPVAKEHIVTLNLTLPPTSIPPFKFDPLEVKKALSSLIDNAIKFNRPGGKVDVVLRREGSLAKIELSDTGPGIKQELLENLFSPFNRGSMEQVLEFNKPGVGLGLYLVKLVADAHLGKIEVRSTEGQGSTFTLSLPIT